VTTTEIIAKRYPFRAVLVGGEMMDERAARGRSHYAAALSATTYADRIGESIVTEGPRGGWQHWEAIGPLVNGRPSQIEQARPK